MEIWETRDQVGEKEEREEREREIKTPVVEGSAAVDAMMGEVGSMTRRATIEPHSGRTVTLAMTTWGRV